VAVELVTTEELLVDDYHYRGGARYVSETDGMSGTDGTLRSGYHIGDGLHLCDQGNRRWVSPLRA
jgi:hypothetical protein